MMRHRLAALALAAGLGSLQGCTSTSTSCSEPGIGHGQLLRRLGIGREKECECMTTGSSPVMMEGVAPGCQGPILEPQGPGALPAYPGAEPPIAPVPRPYMPQAQPSAAGPVSKVKPINPTN